MRKGLGDGCKAVTYRLIDKIYILVLGNINYLPMNPFQNIGRMEVSLIINKQ